MRSLVCSLALLTALSTLTLLAMSDKAEALIRLSLSSLIPSSATLILLTSLATISHQCITETITLSLLRASNRINKFVSMAFERVILSHLLMAASWRFLTLLISIRWSNRQA